MSNMFFNIKLAIDALRAMLGKRFTIKSLKGVTTIEYAFMAILISVAALGALRVVGNDLLALYNMIQVAMP